MLRTSRVPRAAIRCGIDTGGTFTDLIGIDGGSGNLIVGKFPSRASDPVQSLVGVIGQSRLDLKRTESIVLGTTLGLNALLERRGARVIFVTTAGFEDVPFIQRMNRRHHYSFEWQKPKPFVERRDCLGVGERVNAQGKVVVPLTEQELTKLAVAIDTRLAESSGRDVAIAVCLLFSYLNPEHELALERFLKSRFPALAISLSHAVAPIWREYERGCTTVVDAFIKPIVIRYLSAVRESVSRLGRVVPWMIMKSNGGHATPSAAEKQPVNTILSGLSGGIIGGKFFGALAGEKNVITLDMGGTSCDVGLVRDSALSHVMQYEVEWGIPISAPFVDVNSIGAGGGSIGWVDRGGFLRVGPRSAGAEPGPACYSQGGGEATVTDANLVLGRLNPDYFLAGKMKLSCERALAVISALGKTLKLDPLVAAQAMIDVADENMANAIRVISVERGLDPREFALVAFGGAGPLHSGGIAEKIGMHRIVVPVYPGLCSAFGALIADFQIHKVLSRHFRSNHVRADQIDQIFREIVRSAKFELKEEGFSGTPRIERSISMRYAGQNYEHDVPIGTGKITPERLRHAFEKFHSLHQRFYGYSISREVIELIRLNVTASGSSSPPQLNTVSKRARPAPIEVRRVYFKRAGHLAAPVYRRETLGSGCVLRGPAVIEEADSTILLHPRHLLRTNNRGVITITL